MKIFILGCLTGAFLLKAYEIISGIIAYRKIPESERRKLNELLDKYKKG